MCIHNINLIGHRKSACCLWLLVFLEICVIAPFWHWRSQDFPKGCHHQDFKALSETGYNSVLLNIIYRKYEVKMTRILFQFMIYLSCERALKNGRVKSQIEIVFELHFWSEQLSYIGLCSAKLKQSLTDPSFLKIWDSHL